MILATFGLLALCSSLTNATLISRAGSSCRDVTFTLSGSATGRLLTNPPLSLSDPDETKNFFNQPPIASQIMGTYDIYGQYCEPDSRRGRRLQTLDLLVHGITYDHRFWNGLDDEPSQGNIYATAAFLNGKGHATLSIDRLGVGRSDHPDPVNVVQAPFQVELYHDLITQLRNGASKSSIAIPTGWQRILWFGHSYGSILGNHLAAAYPNDVDAMVLTGIAKRRPELNDVPGLLENDFVQASEYDPQRFAPSVYSPGYLVTSSKRGRRNTFYSRPFVDFDPDIYDKDFDLKQTITLGEIATEELMVAPSFSKPLYIVTGRQDAAFCGNGSRELGEPDCGSGARSALAAMKDFFPAVSSRDFDYYTQPNAGHSHQLHRTAPVGFAKVIEFLLRHGL